jgi:hypothetical protein
MAMGEDDDGDGDGGGDGDDGDGDGGDTDGNDDGGIDGICGAVSVWRRVRFRSRAVAWGWGGWDLLSTSL